MNKLTSSLIVIIASMLMINVSMAGVVSDSHKTTSQSPGDKSTVDK